MENYRVLLTGLRVSEMWSEMIEFSMSYVREGGSAFFVSGGILFQNGVPTEVSCFLGVLSSHSRIYIYFARHSNDCKRAVYIYKCIYIDNRKTLYFPRFSEKVN